MSQNRNRKPILIAFSLTLVTAGAFLCLAATPDVGSGAPTAGLTERFVSNFFRNGFANLVSLPPVDNVQRFGATGLIQEFNAVGSTGTGTGVAGAGGGSRLALIKANMTTALPTDGSVDVAQVTANMYSYYTSVGVSTAGFPTTDTLICPQQASLPTCEYQFYNKNYILFTYDSSIFNGSNFALRDPFYTKYQATGGINVWGPAIDIERNVTGAKSITGTVQIYANGSLYNMTSGSLSGTVLAVLPPVYAAYVAAGSDAGYLGLPTSNDILLNGGTHRQTFQGGNLDYTITPGQTPVPVLTLPINEVQILPTFTSAYHMTQGDTLPLQANTYVSNGAQVTGRAVTWATTNSKVIALSSSSGANVVATAVGPGTALVSAVSEGQVSPSLTITVAAQCCQIGDGAAPAAQQAMKDAVTRNQLSIQLPAKSPAQRAGAGYVQQLTSTGTPPVSYLIAKSDASPTAYVVTGDALARYTQLGGAAGSLGYPTSDGAGHQLFQNGALASSPARLVTGAILAKWTTLNFETGAAGLPTADATAIVASTGNKAQQQTFAKGTIFAETSGPRAGQSQLVAGLILNRYVALGGAASAFGLPTDDAFGLDGRTHQDFEGGYIDYGPGDNLAVEHGAQRRPQISSTPSSAVTAGSRLRLSVTGFADQSTLQISITGQPDFVVNTVNGSYIWDAYIPLSAPSQTFAIHAVDITNGPGGASADGSYTVKSLASSSLQIVKTKGDSQSGAPGAQLAQTLQVQLQDAAGNSVSGVAVTFAASTGGQIVNASSVTDGSGYAQAAVRMPPVAGLALFTAQAAGMVATFSATAAAKSLTNYPSFLQSDAAWGSTALGKGAATVAQKGALLTSAAGIVRYYVNRGDLTGSAVDPGALNQYLQKFCATGSDGSQICDGFLNNPDASEQVVNLWRIAGLVGGSLDVAMESPDPVAVRDLVAQGSPVLLALALTANGAPAGGHYIVATGVAADGSVLIHDPSSDFGRTGLNDYLAGFPAGGLAWQGTLNAALRLLPRAPSASGFLVSAISQPAAAIQQLAFDLASVAGPCGQPVDFPDEATIAPATTPPLVSRLRYCDGGQPVYQLSLGESQAWRAALTDLATGGRRLDLIGGSVIAYKVTRPSTQLVLGPQDVTIAANGVLNGASFVPGIAPGGLTAILGSGLAGPGSDTVVQVNGEAAAVVAKSPFQITAQVPPDLAAGPYTLSVQSPYGSAQQAIQVQDNAPAIFVISNNINAGSTVYGMVANQDGSMNSPVNPGQRGQTMTVYCTGLGVVDDGTPPNAQAPVFGILNAVQVQPSFAGLTPAFIGLYQVDLPVPVDTPPGIDLPLLLRQPGGDSNTVFVAIR